MSGDAWYFDFISPFAYLQLEQARAMEALEPRPLLFAGLLEHYGQLGPAEIPSKRRFTYRYVTWAARQQGLPFRFPCAHPFNPLRMLRLCIGLGGGWPIVQRMFEFVWRDGNEPGVGWPTLCEALGVSLEQAAELTADEQVKQALRRNVETAIEQGVFGVPTLVLGAEVFWGGDATQMARDYRDDPEKFEDAAMRALDAVPEAASRPR